MIISIDTKKPRTKLPYSDDFTKWKKNLLDDDYTAIVNELNSVFDSGKVHTAGWIPGHNWIGTVYEPIFKACNKNQVRAALFFGLIVYKVFMDRDDTWACDRFQLDGKEIKSLTYFKVNNIL
ncbi:hypothetical protein [Clostridium frigidicarnis]|nr:hypothetical protein [Clostridium frigidicarnis]